MLLHADAEVLPTLAIKRPQLAARNYVDLRPVVEAGGHRKTRADVIL